MTHANASEGRSRTQVEPRRRGLWWLRPRPGLPAQLPALFSRLRAPLSGLLCGICRHTALHAPACAHPSSLRLLSVPAAGEAGTSQRRGPAPLLSWDRPVCCAIGSLRPSEPRPSCAPRAAPPPLTRSSPAPQGARLTPDLPPPRGWWVAHGPCGRGCGPWGQPATPAGTSGPSVLWADDNSSVWRLTPGTGVDCAAHQEEGIAVRP